MGTERDSERTRAKLMSSATRLFAEQGFNATTVRAIADDAAVHLSALNYHFGSKKTLYAEVVREACQAHALSPNVREQLLSSDPFGALCQVAEWALESSGKSELREWQSALVTWEIWKPGLMFKEVVGDCLIPDAEVIAKLLSARTGQSEESPSIRLAVLVFFGALDSISLYGKALEQSDSKLAVPNHDTKWVARQVAAAACQVARGDSSSNQPDSEEDV